MQDLKVQNLTGVPGRGGLDSASRSGLDSTIGGKGVPCGSPSSARGAAVVSFLATIQAFKVGIKFGYSCTPLLIQIQILNVVY